MPIDTAQLIQVIGALLVLAGFAGVQLGLTHPRSIAYLGVNLVGSALLGVLALVDAQWGFVLLEAVWAIVSAWALAGVVVPRRR